MIVKFPEIKVKLVGTDGNAFAVLGNVIRALKHGGVSAKEVQEFQNEATAGNYDHLLSTAMKWVEVR